MREIRITDIPGFRIGQVEDPQGATGVTAIVCPQGMAAGLDVRGGGPASRDTRTLDPLAAAERIHAVLLAGGSAFGLDAAGGAMRYLEEQGVGLDVAGVKVPLVCQSDIFDLLVGSPTARPDAAMGRAACEAACAPGGGNYQDGPYGAGCGATVGKALGPEHCRKAGIGSFALQVGDLQVGAVVVLNALGFVAENEPAGALEALAEALAAQAQAAQSAQASTPAVVANTTIGAILTNADLSKAQLCKVAAMGHDGMARAIRPVHTSMDGDSLYALSTCARKTPASADLVGVLAAEAVERAIHVAAQ